MNHLSRLLPILLVVSGLVPSSSLAQERPMTVRSAFDVLATGQGETFEAARTLLASQGDLLPRYGGELAGVLRRNPGDEDVLGRVFDLVAERGEDGCRFVAERMGSGALAWTDLVLARLDRTPPCPELDRALGRILEWAPDPAASPVAEGRVLRVLDLVLDRRIVEGADRACRFVRDGSDNLRKRAIATVVAVRAESASACLTRTYADAIARGDDSLRGHLLDAIAAVAGLDWIPTLLAALDHPQDHEIACRHLMAGGDRALASMVFAARTTETPSKGLQDCFHQSGEAGTDLVLTLVDHPAAGVRAFALAHLRDFHSPAAVRLLRDRFMNPSGKLTRAEALQILASYPSELGGDIVDGALGDHEDGIRLLALRLVEAHHARQFGAKVLRVAEEDPESGIRVRALATLWRLGAVEAVPLAVRMVQYEEPVVAAQAARLLGWLGDAKSFDLLVKRSKGGDAVLLEGIHEALWVQSYADPAKGKVKRKTAPKPSRPAKSRVVACGAVRAEVLGKKGPLVIVLPGGSAMDHSWSRPYLDDLGGDTLVAFVAPAAADHVTGLLDPKDWECLYAELGRERAVLVSAGPGGTSALWAASRAPARVSGVVALSAPLPGAVADWPNWGIDGLPGPLAGLARELLADRARFHPDALNAYLARVMAPAQAGGPREPESVLPIAVDAARVAGAIQALSGADVRFRPEEAGGPALLVLPVADLDNGLADTYRTLQGEHPDRVSLLDVSGCGFQPQVACGRKVVKAIVKWAERVEGR